MKNGLRPDGARGGASSGDRSRQQGVSLEIVELAGDHDEIWEDGRELARVIGLGLQKLVGWFEIDFCRSIDEVLEVG
jgi:hypothetical protein